MFQITNLRTTYDLIVGTYGTKMLMNEENPNKNPVRLAQFYWTAFCYVDENSGDSYSWVYMQENDKKSCHSSGDLFMSVQSFTTQFYKVFFYFLPDDTGFQYRL